ncbi:hypothetical protein A3K48_05215 [candidate division WOR-1 bacterium RIFOXYA12_FULL_52_29]|uniref:Uncharacterized protein n=1 Tax=candidate division WOR-1 bacterium RIFOXYC12_FULL_54_18 TaxID=1802584 RepID=A0A1F4T6J8_UNCSA|nr:MAG: hypothetical protein A3K44_05215 [candidate division WOR-1 bacterium RIFOXYA2_FULL_51_19]OGC17945.1 MAG: hypothetical protein A3K48_05215 [candidate division WOR-1 bacterium RIFOXYA12_FULL_52_29]OGC26802.1 MAG: hypothetical protein A3K32_05210 [candidate division WOR-1 bacterium RIFOXYB2_FULL_45_9]OGC28362.1 MAG: hypothetical protein A3K49_05215 [candidate division WOR-1 bacterium RIFOXYC12_FULL_54_18]OGC31182.1 MAG: hypothetical protein A2346_07405 [candidate division WOR-1 bacterium R
MTKITELLEGIDVLDKKFIGTIAFRDEELTLPDGSKVALGLDDGHWVLVYQEKAGASFEIFDYSAHDRKLFVDKKPGGTGDLVRFKKIVHYFLAHGQTTDLITILPPEVA